MKELIARDGALGNEAEAAGARFFSVRQRLGGGYGGGLDGGLRRCLYRDVDADLRGGGWRRGEHMGAAVSACMRGEEDGRALAPWCALACVVEEEGRALGAVLSACMRRGGRGASSGAVWGRTLVCGSRYLNAFDAVSSIT